MSSHSIGVGVRIKQIFAVGIKMARLLPVATFFQHHAPAFYIHSFIDLYVLPANDYRELSERSTKQTMKIDEWNYTIVSILYYVCKVLMTALDAMQLLNFKAKIPNVFK